MILQNGKLNLLLASHDDVSFKWSKTGYKVYETAALIDTELQLNIFGIE